MLRDNAQKNLVSGVIDTQEELERIASILGTPVSSDNVVTVISYPEAGWFEVKDDDPFAGPVIHNSQSRLVAVTVTIGSWVMVNDICREDFPRRVGRPIASTGDDTSGAPRLASVPDAEDQD